MREPGYGCGGRRALLTAAAAVTLLTAAPAPAQLPDPFLVPRGAMRLGFQPAYVNYDRLFDTEGNERLLGSFYTTDSLGSDLFPTLAGAETAVRSITGNPAFRFNAGAFTARIDADVRRFPFSLGLGLTGRLTFVATVPIVTTRVNATALVDSSTADAGWNPASPLGGDADAVLRVRTLLTDLATAAAQLEAAIAAGQFGCPVGTQCDAARALVVRVRLLATDLMALTGVTETDVALAIPPFAPLATSAAGKAIAAAIAGVSAELQSFGLPALAGTLPLPTRGVGKDAVDAVLTGSEFGYGASALGPPRTIKLSGIGDIELGLRLGLLDGPGVRAVVGTIVRLPTGKRDDPANFLDLPPGDRQLDVIWTLDAALEPGSRVGLWLAAAYTLQLPDQLVRRVAPPDRPLAPASAEAAVERNLGDVLSVSLHPALRLAEEFRAFVSASYERKGTDRYTLDGTAVPELEALTQRETWGFGAGILYRVEQGKRARALPIEASLAYHAAFFGSGGRTPKTGRIDLSLRLYYGLWARRR